MEQASAILIWLAYLLYAAAFAVSVQRKASDTDTTASMKRLVTILTLLWKT